MSSRRNPSPIFNLMETLERAAGKETYFALSDLIIDQRLQWRRRGLNRDRVEAYRADIEEWRAKGQAIQFPPIKVFNVEGKLYIVAGFHRHQAMLEAGEKEILGEESTGTFTDARMVSALSNLQHGLEYDEASKKDIMLFMMQPGMPWEHLSNAAIASLLRVRSQTTIAGWIDQLSKIGELKADRNRVLGRDGKWRDVSNQTRFTPEQIARRREKYKLRQAVKNGYLTQEESNSGQWREVSDSPKDTALRNAYTGEVTTGRRPAGGGEYSYSEYLDTHGTGERPTKQDIARAAMEEQRASLTVAFNQAELNELLKSLETIGGRCFVLLDNAIDKWPESDLVFFLNDMGRRIASLYTEWDTRVMQAGLEVDGWQVGYPVPGSGDNS